MFSRTYWNWYFILPVNLIKISVDDKQDNQLKKSNNKEEKPEIFLQQLCALLAFLFGSVSLFR